MRYVPALSSDNEGAQNDHQAVRAATLSAIATFPNECMNHDPMIEPDLTRIQPITSRLLKKGIPMPETVRFRDRLNVESTSCGC